MAALHISGEKDTFDQDLSLHISGEKDTFDQDFHIRYCL